MSSSVTTHLIRFEQKVLMCGEGMVRLGCEGDGESRRRRGELDMLLTHNKAGANARQHGGDQYCAPDHGDGYWALASASLLLALIEWRRQL